MCVEIEWRNKERAEIKIKDRKPKKRRTNRSNYDLRTFGAGNPEEISSSRDDRRRLHRIVMGLNDLNKTYLRTKLINNFSTVKT